MNNEPWWHLGQVWATTEYNLEELNAIVIEFTANVD
jgi:hypothetical protein